MISSSPACSRKKNTIPALASGEKKENRTSTMFAPYVWKSTYSFPHMPWISWLCSTILFFHYTRTWHQKKSTTIDNTYLNMNIVKDINKRLCQKPHILSSSFSITYCLCIFLFAQPKYIKNNMNLVLGLTIASVANT